MRRLDALRREWDAHGLTHFVLAPGAGMRYLTGLALPGAERLTLFGAARDGRLALLLPELEAAALEQAGDGLRAAAIATYGDAEGPDGAVRRFGEALGIGAGSVVGVEGASLRFFEAAALHAFSARLIAADSILAALRMRKDEREAAAIERAAAILDAALDGMLPLLRAGMTEREVAAELDYRTRRLGSAGAPFSTIVGAGPRGALPHSEPSDRRIENGDLVVLDFGAAVDGYAADTTRTIAFGEPSARAARVYGVVRAAQAAGVAACGPGVRLCDIDRAVRSLIEQAGFGPHFTHRTGHGLGLSVHEPPSVVAGETMPAAPGMVFTVEPGVYLEGEFGVRIEDDVLITETGARVLTKFPRDLIAL